MKHSSCYAIGHRIAEIRKSLGLTQAGVAASIGILPGTISDYERGRVDIPISKMLELSKLFGVSVQELVHQESLGNQKLEDLLVPLVERAVCEKIEEIKIQYLKKIKSLLGDL